MGHMDLRRQLRDVLRSTRSLPVGSRGLIAYSGGPDSLCLLHALVSLRDEFRWMLNAAYIDHRLRRANRQAKVNGREPLPKHWAYLPGCIAGKLSVCSRGNVQEEARKARRDRLAQYAAEIGGRLDCPRPHRRRSSRNVIDAVDSRSWNGWARWNGKDFRGLEKAAARCTSQRGCCVSQHAQLEGG